MTDIIKPGQLVWAEYAWHSKTRIDITGHDICVCMSGLAMIIIINITLTTNCFMAIKLFMLILTVLENLMEYEHI